MRKCQGKYYGSEGWRDFEIGYFHCFSVQYEELRDGIGVYPVAIVELPDGSVVEPLADEIQFLDRPGERIPDLMKEAGADVLMPAT